MVQPQGSKLAFPGARGEFLNAQMEEYSQAVEAGNVPDAVANIQRRYFKRFPLTLDDKEEPSPEWLAQVDDNAADPELKIPDEESMSPTEFSAAMDKHKELVGKIEKKKEQIARRLAYVYKKRNSPSDKDLPPNDLIAQFRAKMGSGGLKKPRQKIAFNVWAGNNRDLVDAEFSKRADGVPASQHAQLRSAVYKELFEALPASEQEAVVEEVRAQHIMAMLDYEAAVKSLTSFTPQDRQRAIELVPKFVEPILDTIAEYTGWKWSLQGGGPEPAKGGRLSMLSIHSGYTSGAVKMNFGRSERKAFRTQIMPLFATFLKKCWTVEECKARALPSDVAASANELADVCAGQDYSVAYAVEDDDDDEDVNNVSSAKGGNDPAARKKDEDIRAMERARAAAKKYKDPSKATTKMTSSLDVYTDGSTSAAKVGPPHGVKRTQKGKSVPLRTPPERKTTPSLEKGPIKLPVAAQPKPGVTSTPIISPPDTHRSPTPIRSRPPSPIISRPASPVVPRRPSPQPNPGGVSTPVPPPNTHRAPTPIRSRPPSPIVSRAASPVVSRHPSPLVSRHASPAASRRPSPALTRTTPPSVPRPAAPIASRPPSPVVSHPISPTVSPRHSSVASPLAGSAHVQTASPTQPQLTPSSLAQEPPAAPSPPHIPARARSNVLNGAVAVPDDSIPDVTASTLSSQSKKRKTAASEVKEHTAKRLRPSTTSPAPPTASSSAWTVATPADSPSWVGPAIELLTRQDLGDRWRAVVAQWLEYEQASGFTSKGRLSSDGRPKAVHDWIQRHRAQNYRPVIKVSTFAAEFKGWWAELHPAAQDDKYRRDLAAVKGKNGFLSVLAALLFWFEGIPAGEMASFEGDWLGAVDALRALLQDLRAA